MRNVRPPSRMDWRASLGKVDLIGSWDSIGHGDSPPAALPKVCLGMSTLASESRTFPYETGAQSYGQNGGFPPAALVRAPPFFFSSRKPR